MTESDWIPTLAVLVVGLAAFLITQSRASPTEFRLLAASFGAHVFSAFVQLYLAFEVYGVADLFVYHGIGKDLAAGLREDFFVVFPEVIRVVLQQDFKLSVFVPADGSPVASMCGLTGIACYLLGDSLVAVMMAFAIVAFFGKTLLYQAFKEAFDPRFHTSMLYATMFVPSTVFWTAGIIKEGVAMVGIGPLMLGLKRLYDGTPGSLLPLGVGVLIVALVKPYILMATAGAAGVYLYWTQSVRQGEVQIRPGIFLLAGVVAVGGLLAIGELFPRYSLDQLAQETTRMQAAGYSHKAGSFYIIGDPHNRSAVGHLLYAPVGLLTALYRPLIVEANNPMMLVNGLETTAFVGLTLWALGRTTARRAYRLLVDQPMLVFCVVFVLLLGVPVGLTSANLGTLSRYRMPLVPFQIAFLLVLGATGAAAPAGRRAAVR